MKESLPLGQLNQLGSVNPCQSNPKDEIEINFLGARSLLKSSSINIINVYDWMIKYSGIKNI